MKKLKARQIPKTISSLRELVATGAEQFGDKALYIYKVNKQNIEYSFNQNLHDMNCLGTAFSVLGIAGRNIAVIGDAHPHYMTTYYAAVNSNGVIVPLDKDLPDDQLVEFIKLSEVCAIAYTKSFNGRLTALSDRIPQIEYFMPITPEEPDISRPKVRPIDELIELGERELANGNHSFLDVELDMEKMSTLLFTSGTTGTSKGVMLSHHNLASATNASCQSMEYDDTHVFVDVLPMHHSYEVTCAHFAIQNLGATMCINDSLKNVMRNFAEYKPTALMLVPLFVETMYKKIWVEIEKKGMTKKVKTGIKLSNALLKIGIDIRDRLFSQISEPFGGRLGSIVCGGAPLSPQMIKDFNAFGIFLLEGYGITECSPLVAVNRPNKIRYHSVGQPVKGCQVKIDLTPDQTTGEILVKGENVMLGYYRNEEATKEVFTDDGWFRTGDIGYMDADGYIFITGRKKNLIILSNGKNIFPEELEEKLGHKEGIAESVIIARKNSKDELVITAVIYPDPEKFVGMSREDTYTAVRSLVSELNRELPVYKQIRDVDLRDEPFERTTSKKIKRYLIK